MHKFYHKLPTEIEGIPINLSYNRVLKVADAFRDPEIDVETKNVIALKIFFDIKEEQLEAKKLVLYLNLLPKVLEILGYDLKTAESGNLKKKNDDEKVADLSVDNDRIYASFLQDYGIDLVDEIDNMHYFKYRMLVSNLSSNTALSQAIEIRTAEIPAPNKHNTAQRLKLIKLKDELAIVKETQEQIDERLNAIFDSL